jgi:hypothetical protein
VTLERQNYYLLLSAATSGNCFSSGPSNCGWQTNRPAVTLRIHLLPCSSTAAPPTSIVALPKIPGRTSRSCFGSSTGGSPPGSCSPPGLTAPSSGDRYLAVGWLKRETAETAASTPRQERVGESGVQAARRRGSSLCKIVPSLPPVGKRNLSEHPGVVVLSAPQAHLTS